MKKRTKITLWSILFVIVFTVSALIRVNLLGSAPMRLMQVKWDDTVGTIYNDLNYENDYGHKYDLYVPAPLDIGNAQQLILFSTVAVLIPVQKRTEKFGANITLQSGILQLHLTTLFKLFKRTQAL